MYGIARWYILAKREHHFSLGLVSYQTTRVHWGWIPEQTMSALINQLHIKHFRLTSYWSDVEPTKGNYNFSQLDWEFAMADKAHAKITLVVGLRQPRWPECHPPTWVNTAEPVGEWQPELSNIWRLVVNRYKNNPALESYQLENEYFLKGFGDCTDFSRSRLVSEYNLVKSLDTKHPIIVGRAIMMLEHQSGLQHRIFMVLVFITVSGMPHLRIATSNIHSQLGTMHSWPELKK